MGRLGKKLHGIGGNRQGSIALEFALVLPVLILLIGGVIDFAGVIGQRQRLQAAVDRAALAAARELGLSDARRENVGEVVKAMVIRAMNLSPELAAGLTVDATINSSPLEVAVVARQTAKSTFMSIIVPADVEASAVARIVGQPNICVLALDSSANGAISLEKNARVTGQNCAVFSNSTHVNSLRSKDSAVMSASLICAAGGKDGGKGNFTPEPLTDCPTFDDPLAGRPEPVVGGCSTEFPTKVTGTLALSPGTYCGGLSVEPGARVTLDPGIYVFKDGGLTVADAASLKGAGVGLFFTGKGSVLLFERGSTIDLTAPRSGEMAGLLVFEGRSQPENGLHQILSDDARNLLGTIYLSRGRLHVDANSPIADRSAYTAIVARVMTLYGGPNLVLNTNYDSTDIPVPDGIRGAAQPVALVR